MYYINENTLNEEKNKFVQELYENYKNEETPNTSKILTNQAELEKINKLDENIYYNKDLTPYTLNLYFTDTDKNINTTANFIKSSLKEL
jgi:hypothetical protein